MSSFVMKQYKVTCTKQSIGVIENVDKINKKKINKITDKYLIVCEHTDAPGINPESASVTPEMIEQWIKDNPTIISKKSLRNIKTCLTNNCNVTILIKTDFLSELLYGYISSVSNLTYPGGITKHEYIVQYHYYEAWITNEFRYLRIVWYNNEFSVLDYKLELNNG